MKKLTLTILIAVLVTAPIGVCADAKLDAAIASVNTLTNAAPIDVSKTEASEQTGTAASEILPGNGTRAGYVLGHGNVIPESEWVAIGARQARRGKDYTIDCASGTLFFAEPVRQMDSVRIDYRYSKKATAERSVTGPGMLPFAFGKSNRMNLLYSYRAADPKQGRGVPDILTYGLSSTLSFGASSKISSMVYMATPQAANRLSITANPARPTGKVKKVKKDQLIVQKLDLSLGNATLNLGFQDSGRDFAGFTSLRESNAAPADVLKQLEKEKGIKRMNMTAGIPFGTGSALSLSMLRIEDGRDDITSSAFGYDSGSFRLDFSTRTVGSTFKRFKDLAEADRGQMAREVGVTRTNYAAQFRTGIADDKDKTAIWSGLGITQLEADTGTLTYRTVNLDFDTVKVQADVRKMDPTFNKMTALNDQERARMALIARKQFDPEARIAQVTSKDKNQINKEAGLDRSTCVVQHDGGTWLSLSKVGSEKGGLRRRSVNLDFNRFSLYFNQHSIDPTFDRLSSLQVVERKHFGNEYGMTRNEIGGTFKLAAGEGAFSHRSVVDHQGASVLRRSFDFKGPRLKFRANLQDIHPDFARIMDLADTDKKLLVKERGFKRSDYWVNFQATKDLNIDTYVYDSNNVTAGQTRSQNKYKIDYAPQGGRHITLFRDKYSYVSEAGDLSGYSRRKTTFDDWFKLFGGLLFKTLSDVNTQWEGEDDPVTTTIDQYRLESDQKAATSLTLDALNIDHGDGRFENTKSIGLKSKAADKLSVVVFYSTTDRQADLSEVNGRIGIDWAIRDNLNLKLDLNNREGGPKGSQRAHQFSLKGLLAKRFLMLTDINIDSGINTKTLKGRQIGCDNGLRIDAGFLGGKLLFDNTDKLNPKKGIYYTSRIIQYESDKDPKKWYHFTFFRQNLVVPSGAPANKRNYALDVRLTPSTDLTLTSYFGKNGKKGAVLPVGGTVFKISHALKNGITLIADYTSDINHVTHKRARVAGLGFHGTLSNKAAVELYYGLCLLDQGNGGSNKNVFRVKYDHKMNPDHFLTLTAERKSGIVASSINPFEGDIVARIDYKVVFD